MQCIRCINEFVGIYSARGIIFAELFEIPFLFHRYNLLLLGFRACWEGDVGREMKRWTGQTKQIAKKTRATNKPTQPRAYGTAAINKIVHFN